MNKYITIALIVIAVMLVFIFRNKLMALIPGAQAATPTIPAGTTPPAGLDQNKVLMNGSRGDEVKFLQGLLGVTADGIFGPQTEAALFARKGVKQTSLAQFSQLPDAGGWNSEDATEPDAGNKWYDSIPYGYIFN